MSLIARLAGATQSHSLGQLLGGEGKARHVPRRVRDVPQSIEQSQSLKYRGINADTRGRVAGFNTLQGGAGRERSFGYHGGGQLPSPPGVANVLPKLAQDAAYGC
jgi:hypothetical protein